MQKQAPTVGRLLAMTMFALSCFGILLFLWLSFGGPIPLKAEKFRFTAKIDEAALLVNEADVRIAGLNVGKVKKKSFERTGGTLVEMEIDPKYAPIPKDSKATIRQKTILGQLYVELTPGSKSAGPLKEHATLSRTQVEPSVEIDELLRTFDPQTRQAFRGWIKELAKVIDKNRGQDLNDAIGNLRPWSEEGGRLLARLDAQEPAVRRLVRNSGIALGALSERRGQLRSLIVNANDFFGAVASRNDALAETISIFPTFLEESRLTFQRLERFARDTRPLVRDLIPVAVKLRPTIHDLGQLAPDLEHLFRNLDPLIDESKRNLPEAARFLRGAEPVFESLHLWLPELNPILSFANYQQEQLADFFTIGGGSINGVLPGLPGEGPRHYLRQFTTLASSRGVGLNMTRPAYDRGNAYPAPNMYKRMRALGMTEAFDCKPTGGEQPDPDPGPPTALPPCFVEPPDMFDGKFYPRLVKGKAPLRKPPRENEGTRPATPTR